MIAFYERCVKIYDDYRAVVPPYAAAALSFYAVIDFNSCIFIDIVGTSFKY